MAFVNIDAPGNRHARRAVDAIQRNPGKAERLAAAKARRDRRNAKRAHGPATILLYRWPAGGITVDEHAGAYVQGPNGSGQYQAVVVGPLKGEVASYCDAVSQMIGLKLQIKESGPMDCPSTDADAGPFLSIIMEPAS